jgi:glycosyltransferase involved in cell wall biosynthesis
VSARPILLFSRSVDGGISEYMHAQGNELARRGLAVVMLAPRRFLSAHPVRGYVAHALPAVPDGIQSRLLRRALFVVLAILNPFILAWHVVRLRPRFVLLDSMSELFAPLWAWPHRLLARFGGVRYVATLHDPVRERSLGAEWWHRWSLRAAYAPLSIGLVHDLAAARKAGVPAHVDLVEVPHGIFPVAAGGPGSDLRATLGIGPAAPVALSFGYVVDRKNLGLAIDALVIVPALHLIIAGRRGSTQDRAPESYQAQAEQLGVADRCHIVDRFIDDAELGRFFGAADFLLMTYTGAFVSQSGVLHVAANWSRPVLASGGPGPMVETVRRYKLGEVVEPDSVEALADGMRRMIGRSDSAADSEAWQRFRDEASWARNVDLLLAAVDQLPGEGA